MVGSIPPHTGFSPPQAPTIPVPAKAGWRAGWLALSGGVNGQCERTEAAVGVNGQRVRRCKVFRRETGGKLVISRRRRADLWRHQRCGDLQSQ